MDRKNWVVGALLLVVLFAAISGIARLWMRDRAQKEMLTGNCKIERDFVSVVLIDDTDPITLERDEAAAFILKSAEDSPRYSRFALYKLSDAAAGKKEPALELCNPFGKTDRVNKLTEDANELKRARNKFLREVKKITQSLLDVQEKPFSPIMEGIRFVAVTEFFPLKEDARRNLIVVSDMMQNTRDFSMFDKKQQKEFDRFKRRPYYRRLKTKALENARVSVFELTRTSPAQDDGVIRFWEEYFRDQKTETADFVR